MISRLRWLLTWPLAALRRHPRPFIVAADAVVALLLALAVAVELADGFRFAILGIRISVRSAWRVLAWAALVACLRHLAIPRPSLLSRLWDRDAAAAERGALHLAHARTLGMASTRRGLLVVALFALAASVLLFPLIAQPFSVPDHGDPLFSIWRVAWIAHQLPRDPLHLFDANIFHPHLRTLAYSDALLVPALAAAPFLWLGVHPVLVYTVLFVTAIVLSGATMFLLVRALTGRSDAAFISGLLFAFCAFRLSHFSHLELQVTLWMPLALYWLHRTILTGRVRDGLLTGLAVALQGLSSLYYGVFFVTLLACFTVVLCMARHAQPKRLAVPLFAGALLALGLLLPLTAPYWQARTDVGERPMDEVLGYSAVPSDYLVPHAQSLYRDPEIGPLNGERALFPGVVPVVLAVAGLWPPLSPIRLAYGAGLAFAFDASLGLNGLVYPYLYRYVAPFRGFRAPARYGIIVALMLSILAGYGVLRLIGHIKGAIARQIAVLGLTLLVLLEARPNLSLEPVWKRPPSIYASLPANRTVVLADLPFPTRQSVVGDDLRFMYFSTFHWHRLLNGASGFFPADYNEIRQVMYDFPSDPSLAMLRRYGVEYLVIHAKFYDTLEYARVASELDRRQNLELVAVEPWEGSEVRLYRLE